MKHPRLCRGKACQKYTYEKLCRDCLASGNKPEPKRRYATREDDPARYAFYHSQAWQRLAALQKSLYPYCQWKRGDTGRPCLSTHKLAADHVTPRDRGGLDDLSNLQTLCHEHHTLKTNFESNSYFGTTITTVICGPPGSGKTSYVANRMTPGCIAWDMDRIVNALSFSHTHYQSPAFLSVVFNLRETMQQQFATTRGLQYAYWIEGAPTPERRRSLRDALHAEVIILETPPDVCKSRILADTNRDKTRNWSQLVDDWWSAYQPSSLDTVIRIEG